MSLVLAAIAAALLSVALHDVLRRSLLRRQALRNLVRRPSETLIVIGGALLGTAIITASFVIGDTIDGSIRSIARTDFGPIDEGIVDDLADVPLVLSFLEAPPIEGVDGLLESAVVSAVVATADETSPRAEPSARVYELDFDAARAFGGSPADTGLAEAGPTPGPGEAAISSTLASSLDLSTGDLVDVHAYGTPHRLEITEVLPRIGLAGRGGENLLVGPGTLTSWFSAASGTNYEAPLGLVYVSNHGGVFSGAEATAQVLPVLEERLAHLGGVDVGNWKRDLLQDAKEEGAGPQAQPPRARDRPRRNGLRSHRNTRRRRSRRRRGLGGRAVRQIVGGR
jgi:putative ABC transport system permease protein